LTLSASVVGVETLVPRSIHEFKGMSARLDGFYRMTNVKHVLAPGAHYNCEIVGHKVLSQDITERKATTKVQTKAKPQQS